MQTPSPKIWTWLDKSISYDNNDYTTHMYIYICRDTINNCLPCIKSISIVSYVSIPWFISATCVSILWMIKMCLFFFISVHGTVERLCPQWWTLLLKHKAHMAKPRRVKLLPVLNPFHMLLDHGTILCWAKFIYSC